MRFITVTTWKILTQIFSEKVLKFYFIIEENFSFLSEIILSPRGTIETSTFPAAIFFQI